MSANLSEYESLARVVSLPHVVDQQIYSGLVHCYKFRRSDGQPTMALFCKSMSSWHLSLSVKDMRIQEQQSRFLQHI